MAEPISLAASLITVAITASELCQAVYQTLSTLREVPKQLRHIHSDLGDFYKVLGTLQALLEDEETMGGVVQPMTSINLQNVLNNSVTIFKELAALIKPFEEQGQGGSTALTPWQRVKWVFGEKERLELRKMLIGNKITLNLAISIANVFVPPLKKTAKSLPSTDDCLRYNSSACHARDAKMQTDILTHIRGLEATLPSILQQIEDIKAARLPMSAPHGSSDRETLRSDHDFALRNFLNDATSLFSSDNISNDPSMQVSSFLGSMATDAATFQTAPSRVTARNTNANVAESAQHSLERHSKQKNKRNEPPSDHEPLSDGLRGLEEPTSASRTRSALQSSDHNRSPSQAHTTKGGLRGANPLHLLSKMRLFRRSRALPPDEKPVAKQLVYGFPEIPGEARRNEQLSRYEVEAYAMPMFQRRELPRELPIELTASDKDYDYSP